jgi:2-dehydropantoate 2-reductase
MDALAARFGARVAGGVCKIAAQLDERGRIVQLAPLQELAYGELDGSSSERMARLDAFMQGAGFEARLSDSIRREMWEKWVLLAAMGGVTCLMRAPLGEIEAAHGGAAFIARFLDEVVAVVTRGGEAPSPAFLALARNTLLQKGSKQASSMYRDLQAGHPVEADQIVIDLLRRAGEAGMDTPLLAAAATHLSVYQRRLEGGEGRA